jgi:phosphoadenosine phosphosulfate reductase
MTPRSSQEAQRSPEPSSRDDEAVARVALPAQLAAASPEQVLEWALREHHSHVALACSFSAEDIAVLHMMHRIDPKSRVFAIDTGRLDPETYEVAEEIHRSLGVSIEWYFPRHEAVEGLVRAKGMFSFQRSVDERKQCCHIRKVEPLGRALQGLTAWVTGMRREQAMTRGHLRAVEMDPAHGGITKVNPIAAWSVEDTWNYVSLHGLPYNRLYERGYTQIGCQPCTTPVRPGEDARAGRWRWESPEHKECGLHTHIDGDGI